jgi:hypothetical protein
MVYCSNCGQAADGQFCRNCGAALAASSSPEQRSEPSLLEQTVRSDVAGVVLGIAQLIGLVGGAALWLWLLYDESVVEQSMIWFLGAFPAAIVGMFAARWAVVAMFTR